MRVWKAASPYVFTGYYLHSPCHGDRGWMGHRAALASMGWSVVPIYVGQQVAAASPCKSSALSTGQGRVDAQDCLKTLIGEGFAKGCFAYLDVEHADVVSSALCDYISAWAGTLLAAGFGPGVYCHRYNATEVRAAVLPALADSPHGKPRFWIAGGTTGDFDKPGSQPVGSGIAFADLWQRPQPIERTFGGVTIEIDEDVSLRRDPAGAEALPA